MTHPEHAMHRRIAAALDARGLVHRPGLEGVLTRVQRIRMAEIGMRMGWPDVHLPAQRGRPAVLTRDETVAALAEVRETLDAMQLRIRDGRLPSDACARMSLRMAETLWTLLMDARARKPAVWLELKDRGKRPTAEQWATMAWLEAQGDLVRWGDDEERLLAFIDEVYGL